MQLSRKSGRTFHELFRSMTEEEWHEEMIRQQAFEQFEPLPDVHFQMGTLLDWISIAHGAKTFDPWRHHPGEAKKEMFNYSQFMVNQQSEEEMETRLKLLMRRDGKKQ